MEVFGKIERYFEKVWSIFEKMVFKDTPTICSLAKIWSEVIIWSFRHTWNHFWSFPVTMTSFQKKIQKLLILRFFMSDLFFRNKYKPIVISLVYASKWWVTWLFLHNELENYHFWPLYWQIYSNFRPDGQFVSKWLFLISVPSELHFGVSYVT